MRHYQYMLVVLMAALLVGCQRDPRGTSVPDLAAESAETGTGAMGSGSGENGTGTAAGGAGAAGPGASADAPGQTRDKVNYRYANGIVWDRYEAATGAIGPNSVKLEYMELIRIDGLRDTQVQQKIMDRIRQAAMSLYQQDVPPYRGIKTMMRGQPEQLSAYIYAYPYYNESNLLSIQVSRHLYKGDAYLCDECVPLTFDLRTGNELRLADLFYDGYDYQYGIVEAIRSSLVENHPGNRYSSPTVLAPFETVRADQKFYLLSPDTIELVLDYDTPEFDVGQGYQTLSLASEYLPEGGRELVFSEKYETWDESLYRSETDDFKRHKFLKEDNRIQSNTWLSENPVLGKIMYGDGIYFRASLVESVENPQLAKAIADIAAQAENRFASIIQREQIAVGEYYNAGYDFSTSRYGEYLNVSESYFVYGGEYAKEDTAVKVYHAVTGKQLTLADVFVPGIDYLALLKEAILGIHPNWGTGELNAYVPDLQFYIREEALVLMVPEDSYVYEQYVWYEDLGEENLVLFH